MRSDENRTKRTLSEPLIWFYVGCSDRIEPREIIRATARNVFVKESFRRGKNERKTAIGNDWFKTRKEAAEMILARAQRNLENAKRNVQYATETIAAMEQELAAEHAKEKP